MPHKFNGVRRHKFKKKRVWMPPVWQALSSIFFGVFDRTCVRPLRVAFYDATGRYAVRK